MPNIITLTGASGCGKSTAIGYFLSSKAQGYNPELIKKFKTRPPRPRKDPFEDGIFVEEIPEDCDVVYEQYGTRYGLKLTTLFELMKKGKSPLVILNDVRAVQDIRKAAGPLVKSIFLFRKRPTLNQYREVSKSRQVKDEEEILMRYNKAHATYRIYIENIYLFDSVFLNSFGKRDLKSQVNKFVNSLSKDRDWPLKK